MRSSNQLPNLLLLACLAGPGCSSPDPASSDPSVVAARFLDGIRAGQIEPAWQATSSEFKSLMGLENLRDFARTHPALSSPVRNTGCRTFDRNGLELAECTFTTGPPDGKAHTATFKVLLASHDQGWRVESLSAE